MRDEAGQQDKVGSTIEPRPAQDVAANYRYWREHGGGWAAEYDSRKKEQVYYHIQEIMLAEYIRHHAPAKVLEFGCGPGRHLRYLSRLPGIEIFGYDQSASMVSGARAWASQEWLNQHVTIGMPTGRLPFADGQFDLVYTAEVLVHVRPEDLPATLKELIRISKRQVFHLETSPEHQLVSNEHDGCWWHDLPEVYAGIGRTCEMLTGGYSTHAPYRVMLEPMTPTWEWAPVFLELCRRMEKDVTYTMDIMRGSLVGEKERIVKLDQARAQAEHALAQSRGIAQQLTTDLEQARAEAVSMANWAKAESAARVELNASVRALETRLVGAREDVLTRERELTEIAQREADFVRAVERLVSQ